MENNKVVINPADNVAVYLQGEGNIPAGHKVALKDIEKGNFVVKYGEVIGRATRNIKCGEWVHTHNLASHLSEEVTYSYNPNLVAVPKRSGSFNGYRRKWGRAGIRNEIFIIPTVGCVNNVCMRIAEKAKQFITGSIDGVYALTHQFGCSQLGDDGDNIRKLLSAVALNPNATYVLIVGLGCENNSLERVRAELAKYGRNNIEYLLCQKQEDEIQSGVEIVRGFIEKASKLKREPIDASELCIGLKCGGSDGYSGITANPTVGKVSDAIVSMGGSAVLTEVPEMFGAEQILMNKCENEDVFHRYEKLIVDFKSFYTSQGFPVYENPSPGNKEGGITTLEEKSLGCITKAGSTPVVDVLMYGDLVRKNGVSVLQGPGNDLIASTILAASGCQLILFTTGRGTPFSTFVPTIKVGTNNHISTFKHSWIDFNAFGMDDSALLDMVFDVANGDKILDTESIHEIAFYKTGVTL